MNPSNRVWPWGGEQAADPTRRLLLGAVAVTGAVLLGITDRAPLVASLLGFVGMLQLLWSLHQLGRQGRQ